MVQQTDITVPLLSETATANPSALYKPANDIHMPSDEDLTSFRDLLVGSQSGKVHVSVSVSEHIQADFVHERQRDPAITSDDLIRRMTVAKLVLFALSCALHPNLFLFDCRLCALSLHATELTVELWERAKALDERRKARST